MEIDIMDVEERINTSQQQAVKENASMLFSLLRRNTGLSFPSNMVDGEMKEGFYPSKNRTFDWIKELETAFNAYGTSSQANTPFRLTHNGFPYIAVLYLIPGQYVTPPVDNPAFSTGETGNDETSVTRSYTIPKLQTLNPFNNYFIPQTDHADYIVSNGMKGNIKWNSCVNPDGHMFAEPNN